MYSVCLNVEHAPLNVGHATPPPPPPSRFCIAKRKNGNKGKSRKDFKAETIKRLSPRLKCYSFSYSSVSRIQKFFFSANHGGRQYFPMFLGPSIFPILIFY